MNLIALKQPEEVLTTSPYQDLALGPLVGKLSKKMKVKQTEIGKSAGILIVAFGVVLASGIMEKVFSTLTK